jgi:hypothetical protein
MVDLFEWYVEKNYINVTYGMKRMYVKGRFFLYTTSYHGKEVGNVGI